MVYWYMCIEGSVLFIASSCGCVYDVIRNMYA